MSKKNNNRILLLILVVLVAVFLLTDYLRDKKRQAHALPDHLVQIDSAQVESIIIFPKNTKGDEIKFSRKGGNWQVESKGKVSETNEGTVEGIIAELIRIKPQRLAAKSRDQWKKYAVTDSLATRIVVSESGKGKTLDLYIGKFSYRQQPGGMGAFGNRGISGISYVRLGDAEAVYATEGFLAMSFNRDFNAWRKSAFLKADKQQLEQLTFAYPQDSGFVLTKTDSAWRLGERPADSAAVSNYLNLIQNRQNRNFADDFQPQNKPDYMLTVSGKGMQDMIIQCWRDTSGQYFMHSSLNENCYFKEASGGFYKQLFVPKSHFIPSE